MHIIFVIFLILIYGGIVILAGIIWAIVELVKYIQKRKTASSKATSKITPTNLLEDVSTKTSPSKVSHEEEKKFITNPTTQKSLSCNSDTIDTTIIKHPHQVSVIKDSLIPKDSSIVTTNGNKTRHQPVTLIDTSTELESFKHLIYYVKLLGHEDSRFQLVALKAHEMISKYGESLTFFEDVMNCTINATDFATEIIRFIITKKKQGISDSDLMKMLRTEFINNESTRSIKQKNVFHAIQKGKSEPVYIENETNIGSRKLTAKSTIAHKHKAIQYANIIGSKLNDGFIKSGEVSFHAFINKQCGSLANQGDYVITTESFEPHKNLIAVYKKSKTRSKNRSIATNIITPKQTSKNPHADSFLNILDKLTSSRLPRYEIPTYASANGIIQREYKKENPFDIYTDLVTSEYSPYALKDKRFSILYQLMLFISECLDNGMTEEQTISALSSMRVVKKKDLQALRDRETRFKGLSEDERNLVIDSEICENQEMTALYIDLILQYKKGKQQISLKDYLAGVLIRNCKKSSSAWILLKYLHLKNINISNRLIIKNIQAIHDHYFVEDENYGGRGANKKFYSLDKCFKIIRNEYDHYIGMTRYNCNRDHITQEMLTSEMLELMLPNRFDKKGRLCSIIPVTPTEAELFRNYDRKTVNDKIYMMIPIQSLTIEDAYNLLLTSIQSRKKHKVI